MAITIKQTVKIPNFKPKRKTAKKYDPYKRHLAYLKAKKKKV